jgi:hypothetical protein
MLAEGGILSVRGPLTQWRNRRLMRGGNAGSAGRDVMQWAALGGIPGNYARITSAGAFSNNGGQTATEAFGAGAITGASNQTVIGNAAGGTGFGITCVGWNAVCTFGCSDGVAIGYQAEVENCNNGTAVGYQATVINAGGTALGSGASVAFGHTNSVALGFNSTTTAANQFMIGAPGSVGITSVSFGGVAAAPQAITIGACGGSGSNIAGASITIAGGLPTGTGAPGTVNLNVALTGATSNSTLQSLLSTPLATFSGAVGGTSFLLTQPVNPSGSPTAFTVVGGAHTALTLSTEATDVNFNLARTVQFATGALTTQRAVRFQAPTYTFVGASTLTTAVTVDISGPPIQGTNATITSAIALRVGGLTQINGNLQLGTAGNKLLIATGSNASAGTGTLSGGTVTISTTAVTASSLIFLTDTSGGTNLGTLSVGTITAGTSFVVNSSNALDSSTFNWHLIN